jgi:hypothetical protein
MSDIAFAAHVPILVSFFLFATASRPALRPTQPPIQGVLETISPDVKWPGHQPDHTPPSSAEVKNVWSHTFIPTYVFVAWYLGDKFTFYNEVNNHAKKS